MSDREVRSILAEICGDKERNIQRLETRLEQLGIKASGHGSNFEKIAKLKEVFHSDEDTTLLHRALGDLQAAVIQVQQFRNQLTDPVTVEIFDKIRQELMQSVKRLAKLYHERLKTRPLAQSRK